MSESVKNSFQSVKDLVETTHLSLRSPPIAPDGYYDWQVDPAAYTHRRRLLARYVDKLAPIMSKTSKPQIGAKGAAALNKIMHPEAENDRLGAFENLLSVMSMAPAESKLGRALSDKAVGVLYNAIPHPPAVYLGPKFDFRQADGGSNNVHEPDLGRAGTTYARSVQSKKCIHPSALPDAGLVFDTLLKANDRIDHHGGNSSLIFAFATIITHSLFKTNRSDTSINEASSYLDLSPLYGNNTNEVASIRAPDSNGRGLLRPDTFADGELSLLPPAVSALLVLFNRNHNYIAEMLLKLNEKKRWKDSLTDPAKLKAQDDDIFETARLVNCGHFISMIMNDYVAGFLGLSEGNAWSMNAFDSIKYRNGQTVERGQGNHVSVEFNILYRWHATISKKDEQWTKDFFANMPGFEDIPVDQVDLQTFFHTLVQELDKTALLEPHKRTFGELARGPDGKFSTDDLAKILQDATEAPAGQFRARGIPGVMRPIEMLGIERARTWGVCTLNEFRKFLGLKQFDSFEEWNPDKEIAEAARSLYGHIDNLELYAGLQAEQYMPLSPGLRFSCGYTVTRAVLSDAIALIRGDRFYTTSFTPTLLTTWGFQDATTRPQNGGFGAHLPKLLARHFPRNYAFNNVFTIFPFFTPQKMKKSLERQGIASKYVFSRPGPPDPIPKFIDNFKAIDVVFNDPERFVSGYNLKALGDGYGFMMAIDETTQHDNDKAMVTKAMFGTNELVTGYVKWFRESTASEIKEQSWKVGDSKTYIDIVDVIKTVHTYWAADMLCGIPLKTKANPRGRYTVNEVFDMFADLYPLIHRLLTSLMMYNRASFLGIGDNERLWSLREKARTASNAIQGMTRESILRVAPNLPDPEGDGDKAKMLKDWVREVEDYFWPPEDKPWFQFMSRLTATGRPVNEIVANVVGLANGSSVNQAHSAINVIDFYLQESHKVEYDDIQELIKENSDQSSERLRGYVREAMRLNPQFTGLWRVSKVAADIQGTNLKVQPGDRIWGGFKKAHLNPEDFPDPSKVDPTRDPSKYKLNGGGFHLCIGVLFAVDVITDIMKIVYSLKNVKRAPGDAGQLIGTTKIFNQVDTNQYIKPDGSLTDWPVSMVLAYEDA